MSGQFSGYREILLREKIFLARIQKANDTISGSRGNPRGKVQGQICAKKRSLFKTRAAGEPLSLGDPVSETVKTTHDVLKFVSKSDRRAIVHIVSFL